MELNINVLDIWSFDDEEGKRFDLWKDNKGVKAQPAAKVEKKMRKQNLKR